MKISNYGGGFAGLSFKSSASFYVIFSDLFSRLLIFPLSVSKPMFKPLHFNY